MWWVAHFLVDLPKFGSRHVHMTGITVTVVLKQLEYLVPDGIR